MMFGDIFEIIWGNVTWAFIYGKRLTYMRKSIGAITLP